MNFIPSAHQAAGHDGCLTAGPVFAKRTTPQEIEFYAEATQRMSTKSNLLGSQLAHWMPTYMGTMSEGVQGQPGAMVIDPEGVGANTGFTNTASTSGSTNAKPYLVLLNLYYRFVHPCILDIKLGSVLTDDSVTAEKRERLAAVSRSTTSGLLGFRICGMKMYTRAPFNGPRFFPTMDDTVHSETVDSGGFYTSFDKNYGRALDVNTVEAAIGLFFSDELPHRKLLLTRFHQRLQLLYNCLVDTEVRIISGSLLFLYEGDSSRWSHVDDESYFDADPLVCDPLDPSSLDSEGDSDTDDSVDVEKGVAPLSRLNLIDFAHAKYTDGAGPDDNILDGVENLLDIFGRLAA